MSFSLGLYLKIEQNLVWVLFCVADRLYVEAWSLIASWWKQPLKGVAWDMFSLKLGKADTLNKDMNTLQW